MSYKELHLNFIDYGNKTKPCRVWSPFVNCSPHQLTLVSVVPAGSPPDRLRFQGKAPSPTSLPQKVARSVPPDVRWLLRQGAHSARTSCPLPPSHHHTQLTSCNYNPDAQPPSTFLKDVSGWNKAAQPRWLMRVCGEESRAFPVCVSEDSLG